jgi:hypothetical protein
VPPGYTLTAWSSDGRAVFLTGGAGARDRAIVAYRPGVPRARRLAVTVGRFTAIAAG